MARSFPASYRLQASSLSLESVTAGVGAPEPSALNLSCFDVLVPRWRVGQWQFQLARIVTALFAYPSFLVVRHVRLPSVSEAHSITDEFHADGQAISALRKGAHNERRK